MKIILKQARLSIFRDEIKRKVENVIEQERKVGKKALRLDVIENNTTAEKLYQKLGFRYIQTKTLYYDVVGEMTFKLYELVL